MYKKELHRAHRDYLTKTEKELREYSMSDPKKLWKILKDFDKKNSDNIEYINLDALHDYFRILNDVQTNVNDTGIYNDTLPHEHIDMILNSDITRDEIKNVIANLKNNKASGYDDVLNEHIKCTVDIIIGYCTNMEKY